MLKCFTNIKIDAEKEFNYRSNLAFLIERSRIVDEDKQCCKKIAQFNLETDNFAKLIDELKQNYKQGVAARPVVYVVAGNIGSGKSTLIHILCRDGFIGDDTFIILEDVYKKIFFDNVNDLKKAYRYAKTFVCEQIKKSISCEHNFILELVPSSEEKIGLLNILKTIGYKAIIYYLETNDISVNQYRIKHRFNEGADYVPESKIVNRKKLVSKYYPDLVSLCDELYFLQSYDNEIKLIYCIENGVIKNISAN